MSHAREETLSVNRFLYGELAKVVPVVALYLCLVVDFFRSKQKVYKMGLWTSFLVLFP
jgi:hypothetical protein